jgi:hypothetical protein
MSPQVRIASRLNVLQTFISFCIVTGNDDHDLVRNYTVCRSATEELLPRSPVADNSCIFGQKRVIKNFSHQKTFSRPFKPVMDVLDRLIIQVIVVDIAEL